MTQVLLAIDTSQGTAVALLVDGKVATEIYEPNSMLHAEQIGQLIARALAESGKKSTEVTAVAVGVGPAPFTGLRVGIAAAKMFAEGVSAPIFGVGSLDAIAFAEDLVEPTLVITDARRSEVYFGLYQGKTKQGVPVTLLGPGVKKLQELEAELQASGQKYTLFHGDVRASKVGLLALAQLADGSASSSVQANYLRAPDAVASKGKKVSG
jgi:tRNA threonylcarbamoyladenosine biosynthesis protein TsaB